MFSSVNSSEFIISPLVLNSACIALASFSVFVVIVTLSATEHNEFNASPLNPYVVNSKRSSNDSSFDV